METAPTWHFGQFAYDPATRQLTSHGEALPAQPKVLDALALLLGQPHAVVSRETLMRELWPGIFVTDNSLEQVIRKLRRALGDTERPHRVVETVPGRGYRLLAEVRTEEPEGRHGPRRLAPVPGFVGRAAELTMLEGLVAQGSLVTVLGPGGSGKTYLVRQLASELARSGREIHWCDLSPARDRRGVLQALQDGIAPPAAGPGLDAIVKHFANRSALLLLDNVEQVAHEVADVVEVLLDAGLALLATSRVRLDLDAERCMELGPMATPEAVQLLRDRAEAARPGLAAGLDDERSTRIVTLLEGMPLAIRLAAARLVSMSPAQLVERLEERIGWLRARSRDLPSRQLSLLASVHWSWDLLSERERVVASGCAVFRGGFVLEAAEAVLDDGTDDVADVVMALRDASMLVPVGVPAHTASRPRFALPQPVLEFVLGDDGEAGLAAETVERHAAWAASLWEGSLHLDRRPAVRQRVNAERENLWAAARRSPRVEHRVRCARMLYVTDYHTTEPAVLLELLDGAVRDAEFGPPTLLFGVLDERALYLHYLMRLDEAERDARRLEALALQQPEGDGWDLRAEARSTLARIAFRRQDFEKAIEGFREVLELADTSEHYARPEHRARAMAGAWYGLAYTLRFTGDYDDALTCLQKALEASREAADPWHEALVLHVLGETWSNLGRRREAEQAFREALDLHGTVGDATLMGKARISLTRLLHDQGELEEAEAAARDTVASLESPLYRPFAVNELGRVLVSQRRYREADALLAEAEAQLEQLSQAWDVAYAALHRALLFALQGRPTEAAATATRAMSLVNDLEAKGFEPRLVAVATLCRAVVALAVDDAADAVDRLGPSGDGNPLAPLADLDGYRWLGQATLARAQGDEVAADKALGAFDLIGVPEDYLLRWLRELVETGMPGRR